jgi:hypothetical protein
MSVNTRPANRRAIVPIGTIVAFYDFGVLSFDTKTWAYCAGQVISDVDSPLNTIRLPDLSGRYLVGYGTEKPSATDDTDGNQDIGTAGFSRSLVGIQGSVYDFSHTHSHTHYHTLNSHTHTFGHTHGTYHNHAMSHTHTLAIPAHTHRWMFIAGGENRYTWNSSGGTFLYYDGGGNPAFEKNENYSSDHYTSNLSAQNLTSSTSKVGYPSVQDMPNTEYDSTATGTSRLPTSPYATVNDTDAAVGNTGYSSTPTSAAIWTDPRIAGNTDIRPRSVSVRFLMRIA